MFRRNAKDTQRHIMQRTYLIGEKPILAGEGEALNDSASEVLEGFRGEAAVERLVASVELGIGLLQQGGPELGRVRGVEVDEPALVRRQPVVHQNLNPVSEMPESEPEEARVTNWFAESAAWHLKTPQ